MSASPTHLPPNYKSNRPVLLAPTPPSLHLQRQSLLRQAPHVTIPVPPPLSSPATTMEFIKSKTLTSLTVPEKKHWIFPLITAAIVVAFLLGTVFNITILSNLNYIFRTNNQTDTVSVQSLPPPPLSVPRLAYLVSGSNGDLDRLWRTVRALYHPHNLYVLHLDLESPEADRLELAARVANETVFVKMGNVHVIKKSNMVTYKGPTMVATTLHACAILLRMSKDWDWFINLSASDYPLVTQDDLLHTFTSLPKNLNFIEHTSRLGWKEAQRARPLIVDPGLYTSKKSDVFWVVPRRELPTAFRLFTGSAWTALTREFVEFCIWGWDNLPRTLLMYYTNFVSSPEGYFQTVICNSPEFVKTVVNHDLHYISWDFPPKQHPHTLGVGDTPKMIGSDAPFARKFNRSDPVLDKIDIEFLNRKTESFVPGGWCSGKPLCSDVGDPTKLKPGPGAKRLARLMKRLLQSKRTAHNQCI